MPEISLSQTRLPAFGSMAQVPASSLPGVSIVVCCHNSVSRLGPTLKHLASQTAATVPWEVIIVDNASTDASAAFAQESWPKTAAAPLRIVSEPNPGLAHARLRGLNEAAYPIVSLVDDDNWVCPEWISLVSDIMTKKPAVGAVGCLCEGAYEEPPPAWFSEFGRSYAIGAMAPEAANVTWTRGYLFGAGLSIRKSAWQSLREQGFTPFLSDRAGAALTSGGDAEICKALRLAGWELYYEPRLRLQHYMPAGRLKWEYLRRLRRGFGTASVTLDAYNFAVKRNRWGISKFVKENIFCQTFYTLRDLAGCGLAGISSRRRAIEGNAKALVADFMCARLRALWQNPGEYGRRIKQIRRATWRAVQNAPEHRSL